MKKMVGMIAVVGLFMISLQVNARTAGRCFRQVEYSKLQPFMTNSYDCVRCMDEFDSTNCDHDSNNWCTIGGKTNDECTSHVLCSKLVSYGTYIKNYVNKNQEIYKPGKPITGNCDVWHNHNTLLAQMCKEVVQAVKELLTPEQAYDLYGKTFDEKSCADIHMSHSNLIQKLMEVAKNKKK